MDLISAYSNRADLRERLVQAAEIVAQERYRPESVTLPRVERQPRTLRDRYTVTERQELRRLYAAGRSAVSLADLYGVSLSTVKRHLRRHGVRKRSA